MKGCEKMRAKDFRILAWNQLKKNYWMVFVVSLIIYALSSTQYFVVGLIISGPLMVGYSKYLLDNLADSKNADKMESLFHGFKESLGTSIISHILRLVFVFLWSLLFIIPGIIKALAYSMTPYVIAENPNLTATEAIDKSQELMKGNKWRLFCLFLSFIGWFLLGALAFGIGTIFVIPYVNTAVANFYNEIRGKAPNDEYALNFE